MTQQPNETAYDFLLRLADWSKHEEASLLMSLPSIQAIVDYMALWTVYDTDFMSGIEELILCGEADPQPLRDFVAKYNLDWSLDWIEDMKAA